MRFVFDNSVVMRWLFGDGASPDFDYAERIPGIMQMDGSVAMAPAVWPLEVGNLIVGAESRNLLPEARSAQFLALLQDMAIEIEFRNSERALTDTLQLARRHKLSTYCHRISSWRCAKACRWQRMMPICEKRWKERVAPSPEPECRSTDCASRHDHRRRTERIDECIHKWIKVATFLHY